MSIAEQILRAKEDYDAVYEAGKQAESGAFWDKFQDYGNRTNWRNGCSGEGWDDENFTPKYPFVTVDAYMMFTRSKITHLPIEVDFSTAETIQYCFWNCKNLLELPIIKATNGQLYGTFNGCNALHTIEKIILPPAERQGSNWFNSAFDNCNSLVSIDFEGVIGQNINFNKSPMLSMASITSVINALSDTTSGRSVTFSKTAKEAAFTADEWAALIATKPNWTINLV